jgi:hypothetical protein
MTAVRRMAIKALSGASAVLIVYGAPAAAQNSDTPVDVTAAPAPSAGTIGPSQLQNFNLQGTVTRPAEGPAATSAQPAATVPRPSAAVPAPADSSSSISPTASTNRAAESRARPVRPADTGPSFSARASTDNVTPSLPLDVTTNQAPQPSYDGAPPPSAAPLSPDNGFFTWPWLAALAALIGGGAFIGWSRRGRRQRHGDPGRLAFAGLVPDAEAETAPFPPARPRPDPIPPRGQPAPRPDPVPPPAPKPKPADDGLIVSTGLKPQLNVQFQPDRAVVTESEVLLQFDVTLTNSGSAPARDVLVEGRLVCAHAGQDQEIAAFFHEPQATGDRMAGIPPLGKIALKSAVRLPLDQLRSFEVEGRTLFVPLVAFNILFRSGAGEGQASASFLVGRGNDEDEKLAPFRLDLGPRIFRGLSARPHSMGLTR